MHEQNGQKKGDAVRNISYATRRKNVDNIKRYVNKIDVKNNLQEKKMKICEGLVTIEEANDVIKDLRLKKSPGLNGLTAEFYKEFWPDFGQLVIYVFNEAFVKSEFCPSQRESVMSLIYKKGERENIANYRPISLINTDYKILAIIMAKRMQKVL